MNFSKSVLIVVLAGVLSACGGGGSAGGSGLSGLFTLTVNTTGLPAGQSYTIQDAAPQMNLRQTMTISQNGALPFSDQLYTQSGLQPVSVDVSITQQPTDGTQCVIQQYYGAIYNGGGPPHTNNGDLNVSCGKYPAVKPVVDEQIGAFPGVAVPRVIGAPQIVPVFFTGSTNVSAYQGFLKQLVVSKYWSTLSEYGISRGTMETAINAATNWPAGVMDSQVRSIISNNNAWGAPLDANTVLVLFLPGGTTYMPTTFEGEATSATGEHGQITVNGVSVQFVVVPADNGNGGAPEQFGVLTKYLVDAVSNPGGGGPNISGSTGYVEATLNPDWWVGYGALFGYSYYQNFSDVEEVRELGSACNALAPPESDITLPSTYLYGLPEIYSDRAAAGDSGYNYCGREPYGVAADWSSSADARTVKAVRFGQTFTDEALVISPGSSTSLMLTAWSLSPTIVSNNGAPTFDVPGNINGEWVYLTGNAVPQTCTPADTSGVCADVPAFTIIPVISANAQSAASCNNSCDFPQTTNGDTFKLTVTMPAVASSGLWVMYIGDQPIAVSNAATWQ